MNTLKTVQTLSNIGKILSKIVFIFCIVGVSGAAMGLISLALGIEAVKIGGVTFKSILQNEAGVSTETLYCTMIVAIILCAGEGVVSKFAEHYFSRELKDGTPFTFGGSKELLRLGILEICIPFGTLLICEIIYAIFKAAFSDILPFNLDCSGSISLGVMFIIGSLLCKLGAENSSCETPLKNEQTNEQMQ